MFAVIGPILRRQYLVAVLHSVIESLRNFKSCNKGAAIRFKMCPPSLVRN